MGAEELQEAPTKEQVAHAHFHQTLRAHVTELEKIVNNLSTVEEQILFSGGIEQVAESFKQIYLNTLQKSLAEKGTSKGQIKKILLNIEQVAKQIMVVRQTPKPK